MTVHRPVPVLYGIKLANGVTSYAYDHELRVATEDEVAAYDKAVQGWRRIRESHSQPRPAAPVVPDGWRRVERVLSEET